MVVVCEFFNGVFLITIGVFNLTSSMLPDLWREMVLTHIKFDDFRERVEMAVQY